MSKPRQKELHAFIAYLLEKHECSNLKELSEKTDIPYTTLIEYARPDGQKAYKKILEDAQKLGVEPGLWLSKLAQI
ncbi:MAG: hypothetical protein JSS82_15675 [Bacteroidetes bacterium]|nr:hypothetical protein [Bacteroidota bacterium]